MKGILETVASVVERLSLSSAEKKRLKQELETALLENECQRVEMQARVVGEEARGNWLQRSWRPVLMLAFARSEERRVGKECRSRWSPYH